MRLYIDPGTGSMLFTILIGIFGTLYYVARLNIVKLKMLVSRGKATDCVEKNPIIIFSDNKRYQNVFKPICEEFEKRGVDVVYMTASKDDPVFSSGLKHIKPEFLGEGNKAFAKLNFVKATVLVSTTPGLDVYQQKRSKDVDYYIHVLHAANDVSLYKMFGLDYYDSVIVNGQFQVDEIRKLEKLRNLKPKEIVISGIPYMDEILNRITKTNLAKVSNACKTVLIAPTWGPSSLLNKFGDKLIDELLKTDMKIILRPHPQSFISEHGMIERLKQKYPESEKLKQNTDIDNFNVLNLADIMISDFSGVALEFALIFDKPLIYTDVHLDKGQYDAWQIDDPTWTETILPKIGEKLTEDKLSDIKNIINNCFIDEKYKNGRDLARSEAQETKSNSSVFYVDYILDKVKQLNGRKEEC